MERDIDIRAARAAEHLATAVVQADPRRRLALVALALKANPRSAHARGLLALSLESLAEAAQHLEAACRPAPAPAGASPELRAVPDLCRAVRDLAALDPHAALERTGPLLRAGLSGPVAVALARTHMASAAACGDVGALARGLAFAGGLAESLRQEVAWFTYLRATLAGRPEAPELGARARRDAGAVLAPVLQAAPDAPPGNVGYLGAAPGYAVASAAAMPGLFAAGVLGKLAAAA